MPSPRLTPAAWRCLAATLTLLSLQQTAQAEFLGSIAAQGRWWPQDGLDPQQESQTLSAALTVEWYEQFNEGRDSLNAKLFYRQDSADDERSHGDIRELYWQHVGDNWELTAGINKIFWGVTESQHLVDIINQTDLVEAPDGEEKFGQPMIHLALLRDWGVVDLFALPGFRERSFAGAEGRLRSVPITVDKPRYEDDKGDEHIDYAARWSNFIGDWSVGVSAFYGTSRDPVLEPIQINNTVALRPYYPIISQGGIDAQYIVGDWLWKFEGIYRGYDDAQSAVDDYSASTAGFEYTLVGIVGTNWDLGLISEYSWDSRGNLGTVDVEAAPYQNDIFLGGRISLNDVAGSELLFGVIQDVELGDSRVAFLEASTRFGNATRATLEIFHFNSGDTADAGYVLRRDSFIELGVEYFF